MTLRCEPARGLSGVQAQEHQLRWACRLFGFAKLASKGSQVPGFKFQVSGLRFQV